MEFTQSVVINRSPEQVFAFLSDTGNETQWQTGLLESKLTSDRPGHVGATERDVRKFMGRKIVTTWEVTEYELNRDIGFRVISGPVPFQGGYAFEMVDGGTRLTLTAHAEMSGLSRAFEPWWPAWRRDSTSAISGF